MLFGLYIREIYFFNPENVRGIRFESPVLAKLLIEELFLLCSAPLFVNRRVHKFAKRYYAFLMSIRPFVYVSVSPWTNSAPTERIFMKFYI